MVQTLVQSEVQVGLLEAYLPEEKDFRPLISKAKAQRVDGFALVSYLPDASRFGSANPDCAAAAIAVGDQFPQMAGRAIESSSLSS